MGTYQPLNYWQMKRILEDNGMYLLQLYNSQKQCHDFTIMQGDTAVRANLGLMDVETFILQRNLKRAEHPNWSSEDRLERQTQTHLESAALHRDDPMF